MLALLVNLLVCVLGTLLLKGRVADGRDRTEEEDDTVEAGDPGVDTGLRSPGLLTG